MFSDGIKIIRNSTIQGKGTVAQRRIRTGEIIYRIDNDKPLVRLHEILSWPADERLEFMTFAIQVDKYDYIFREGNIEYMNHSCDPNAWWEGYGTLVAHRDIMPGEELAYDYSTVNIQLSYKFNCMCGSPLCRGMFSNKDYLRADFQEKYGNHLPRYVLEAIQDAKDPGKQKKQRNQLPEHVVKALEQANLDEYSLRQKYGDKLPQHVLDRIMKIISEC